MFSDGTFSTDTPSLHSWMEGVQEVSPALGHDKPVSDGCPLYNEASAFGGWLVISSNVIAQRLDQTNIFLLVELSIIDYKDTFLHQETVIFTTFFWRGKL